MVPKDPKDLIPPCACRGTLHWCHWRCLHRWYREKRSLLCELCRQPYDVLIRVELVEGASQEQEDWEDPTEEESQPRGVRRPQELEESNEQLHPVIIIDDEDNDEGEEGDLSFRL